MNLPSEKETDLAIALVQKRFFLPSALEMIKSLRNATGEKILGKTEKFRRCFKPLQAMNEAINKVLAGGSEESEELRRWRTQEARLGWEDAELARNGHALLQITRPSSDE